MNQPLRKHDQGRQKEGSQEMDYFESPDFLIRTEPDQKSTGQRQFLEVTKDDGAEAIRAAKESSSDGEARTAKSPSQSLRDSGFL